MLNSESLGRANENLTERAWIYSAKKEAFQEYLFSLIPLVWLSQKLFVKCGSMKLL